MCVAVSICSVSDVNCTSSSLRPFTKPIRSCRLRPRRSRYQTTSMSPGRRLLRSSLQGRPVGTGHEPGTGVGVDVLRRAAGRRQGVELQIVGGDAGVAELDVHDIPTVAKRLSARKSSYRTESSAGP